MIPLHDDRPTSRPAYVTVTLIVACVLVFLWQLAQGSHAQKTIATALGVVPAVLLGHQHLPTNLNLIPPALTVVTSMFLHGGWLHLIGNMLYLYIFGNNVEDSMGHARFSVFYLLSGVVAAFTQALFNPASLVPMIGASGAISGVLGAYLLLYPRARVLVIIPLGILWYTARLPALMVLGFWFVWQLLSKAVIDSSRGGVAFGAHIGGFLAGMVLIPFFKRRSVRLLAPRMR
jgi:membrane associated rhomboid family serine protease